MFTQFNPWLQLIFCLKKVVLCLMKKSVIKIKMLEVWRCRCDFINTIKWFILRVDIVYVWYTVPDWLIDKAMLACMHAQVIKKLQWCGVVLHGVVCVVWCGIIWCGLRGVVWYHFKSQFIPVPCVCVCVCVHSWRCVHDSQLTMVIMVMISKWQVCRDRWW